MVASFCVIAAAQSGRRPVRPAGQPAGEAGPAVNSQPATPPAGAERALPKIDVLVAGEIKTKDTNERARLIYNNFVIHLGKSGLKVNSLGLLKREEAVRRAQGEAEAYVVLLQLEPDNFQGGRIVFNSPDVVVKYAVYAPRTAQPKAKGKVYYQAVGGARGRAGSDDPVKITPEAAGIEAADRVLDWFRLAHHRQQLD